MKRIKDYNSNEVTRNILETIAPLTEKADIIEETSYKEEIIDSATESNKSKDTNNIETEWDFIEYIDSITKEKSIPTTKESTKDTDHYISFGLPDILFVLTINHTPNKENISSSLVGKMVVVREVCRVNLSELSNFLAFMKIDVFTIVSIDKFGNNENDKLEVNGPTKIKYINISYSKFEEVLKVSNEAFLDFNKHTLYILKNASYIDVKNLFTNIGGYDVNVGRGGSQKAHVMSPLELRLSSYLLAMFNFNYKFISYLNVFNDLQKHRYLPFSEKTKNKTYIENNKLVNKSINDKVNNGKSFSRQYHTFRHVNNINRYKNANIAPELKYSTVSKDIQANTSVFNYLDQIDEIISRSSSLYNAQKEIETSWISLMKKKLEDPSVSTWKMLPELIKKSVNTLEKHDRMGIGKKRFKLISSQLNRYKYEVVLLTIAMLISNYNKTGATNISVLLGSNISFLLFKETLIEDDDSDKIDRRIKFEEWKKSHNLDNNTKLLKLGDYYLNLFTNEPTQIFEFALDDEDLIDTSSERIIKISPEYIDMIKDSLIIHPTSLPMICEPLEWNENSYGGFIENKFDQEPINTGSSHQGHRIDKKDSLYKAVNILNKTKFNVNKELLEYIQEEGSYLLDEENDKKIFQNNITLKVAKIYSKYDFYLNVNSDWRSRLYTNSFFLSYQGGDLSRSLIEFAEGETLTSEGIKYLYIFGTNCYSSKLGKKSINQRVYWVKKNMDKIISLDKEFISKANKKLQFTAFCLAVKNYQLDNNYKIKLPVFLDATCSGLQHLAAMLHDINLATHVNLLSKTEDDNVNDLYESMVLPINNEINNLGKEDTIYSNLKKVELTRDILKQSIMTQVYSVTVKGIYGQLTKKFKKIKTKVLNPEYKDTNNNKNVKKELTITTYFVPAKKEKVVELSVTDVYKMAEIIKNASFNLYPSLKEIYTYFIDSAKLTSELSIPLVWFTPAGLEIQQFYYTSKINKVTLSYFGKSRTSVLRDWESILNKTKQNQSIIPNIIHSLDASHLINVINCGHCKGINPIISIHDCFGTHPNTMGKLADIVRSEFVLLYTEHNFLEKYNEILINTIKNNNYDIVEKNGEKYVSYYKTRKRKDGTEYQSRRQMYLIPSVPKIGNFELKEIINATYLIN